MTEGSTTPTAHDGAALTARELDMLAFERTWWMLDEPKDTLIRARFACSADEYYQALNRVIDHPAALQNDPLVVRRLRRSRDRRRRARIDGGGAGDAQGGSNA
jgi:hypothetical protein